MKRDVTFHAVTERCEILWGCFLLQAGEKGKGIMIVCYLQEGAILKHTAKSQFFNCPCHIRKKRRRVCGVLVPMWIPALLSDEGAVLKFTLAMQGGCNNWTLLPQMSLCWEKLPGSKPASNTGQAVGLCVQTPPVESAPALSTCASSEGRPPDINCSPAGSFPAMSH